MSRPYWCERHPNEIVDGTEPPGCPRCEHLAICDDPFCEAPECADDQVDAEVVAARTRLEDIVFRQHDDGRIEVLTTPPLSSITVELLEQLDPAYRDPTDPEVLVFAPHAHYRLGEPTRDGRERLLHRMRYLPPTEQTGTGRTQG